jgi:hypothetical protein
MARFVSCGLAQSSSEDGMTDSGSQTPQSDDQSALRENPSKHMVSLSAIFSASIILIALGFAFTALSRDDCTTETNRYADGRVVSERICE